MIQFIKTKISKYKLKNPNEVSTFGYEIKTHHLSEDGDIQYAQWLHPREGEKTFTQSHVNLFKKYINPGDLVIDVGAHSGDTTIPYALAAGPTGCVLGLEPNKYVYEVLKANANLNKSKTNIIPLNFAATENDETLEFLYSDNGFCNGGNLSVIKNQNHKHSFKLKVTGKNLTNYVKNNHSTKLSQFKLIKTDTEGYDLYVLKSIKELLIQYKPIIICEVLKKLNPQERQAQYDYLKDLGYDIYKYSETDDLKGVAIKREDLMNWDQYDFFCEVPGS